MSLNPQPASEAVFSFRRIVFFIYLALIFSLGFMRPSFGFENFRIPITDFIFILAFPVWLLSVALKKNRLRLSKFYLPLIFYLAAMIVSTVFSESPKESFIKLLGEIYLLGLAVMSFNLISSLEDFKKVFLVWLAATFIVCLISAISIFVFYFDRANPLFAFAFSHYGTLPPGNYPRLHSTYLNANMLCNYLSVGFLMLFAAMRLKWINPFVGLISLVFLAIGSAFTISPSLGGILMSAGLWLWLVFKCQKREKFARISFIGAIFCAVMFFLATLVNPVLTGNSDYLIKIPFVEKTFEPSGRVLVWQAATRTWAENPFVGRGIGLDVARVKYVSPSGGWQILGDGHQMWLNFAGQTGTIGFITLCFLCVFLYRRVVFFSFADRQSVVQTALGIAFISAFLYQGLTGSYEDARHLWVLIGLAASISEKDFPECAEND